LGKYYYLCPKKVRMKKVDFVYDIEEHEKFFYSLLPENLKRKYAGLKAMEGGYYGVSAVSKKFCIHKNTVRVGKNELIANVVPPVGRIRQKGGGRKKNFSC
jgi:CRISPR/Cas system endoribonuclease Cas6 (RAMP superfamily)